MNFATPLRRAFVCAAPSDGFPVLRLCSCSGVVPKALPERRFEGIKLEGGASSSHAGVSQFQVCGGCYQTEGERQASGIKSRLPGSLGLTDLVPTCKETITVARDMDPDMENEFFETRQVRSAAAIYGSTGSCALGACNARGQRGCPARA